MKKLTLLLCLFVFNSYASLKISSFNIRNFDKQKNSTDKIELLKIIQNLDADLMAVEEIYNNNSFIKFVQTHLPDYELILSQCGGRGKQNVGLLYRKDKLELNKYVEDEKIAYVNGANSQGKCASLRPALLGYFKEKKSNKKFVAIAVHLKAGSGTKNYNKRWKQYDYIAKMVKNLKAAKIQNIVMMGDFNSTGFNLKDQDYKKFLQMLSLTKTQTISQKLACTAYWGGKDYNDNIEEPSILDHVVYTQGFLGMALKRATVGSHCQLAHCQEAYTSVLGRSYQVVSDHCPVTAVFE